MPNKNPVKDSIPLSYNQLLFWYLYFLESDTVNIGGDLLFECAFDVAVFNKAFNRLISYHEALSFCISDWKPSQTIKPIEDHSLKFYDYERMSENEKTELQANIRKLYIEPFNLSSPPLVKGMIVRFEEEKHLIVLVFPHIVIDGSGIDIFLKHLELTYHALIKGEPFPLPPQIIKFSHYVSWERELVELNLKKNTEFWTSALNGTDDARFPDEYLEGSMKIMEKSLRLNDDYLLQLQEISARNKATLNMALMAIVGIGVYLTTDDKKFQITSILGNRELEELDQLIAPVFFFMITPFFLSYDKSFTDVLKSVREHTIDAYEHKQCPQSRVLSISFSERWGRTPKWYISMLRMVSYVLHIVCKKEKVYRGFFMDMFFQEPTPPECNWRNIFRKRKEKIFHHPEVSLNIMPDLFSAREHNASVESPTKNKVDYFSNIFKNSNDSNGSLGSKASGWKSTDIMITVARAENGGNYINIRSYCLNEAGFNRLSSNIESMLEAAIRHPERSFKTSRKILQANEGH